MHDRWETYDGGADPTVGYPDHVVLGVDPRRALGDVTLGAEATADAAERQHRCAAGADERFARALERGAIVSIALRSPATAPRKSPARMASCHDARWMTRSAAAALAEPVKGHPGRRDRTVPENVDVS